MKKFLKSKLIFALVVVTILFGIAATLTMKVPAMASGSYNNANIATDALTHVGEKYGECWPFVRDMIYQASNHTQDITAAAGGNDYFLHLQNAGGTRITDINALSKGDVVQQGEYGGHTFIIVSKVSVSGSTATYNVVDSNHAYNDVVMNYNRTFSLSNDERAYRFGTVKGSSSTPSNRLAALQYNSEMDVFKLGGDKAIWKDTWQPANNAWSGWNSLGGVLASDPVAIKYNSEMDVFAITSNGQVVKDTWNGTSWSNWNSLGGTMVGKPAAVQYGSSEMDVYARGTNNQIYKDTWNGSFWSGWNSLGGSIAGNPTAMIYGGSEMDVWARGTDGALWKDGWNGSSWGGFSSMGGSIVGDPVAIQYNAEMDVYANTPSGELFKRTWNGSSWSSWVGMPGVTFTGSPAALQYSTEMDVFARGANDSYIYKDTWQPSNNSWSGWNSLGGNEAGDPTAIQYSTEMDVYATNYAKNTDKDTWLPANNNWSGFTALL